MAGHPALQETGTPREGGGPPSAGQERVEGLDSAAVARALGHEGRAAGGVYSVTVPRAEPIREHGSEVPASMGLGTASYFQAAPGGKAAVTGDFVLTAAEIAPVWGRRREARPRPARRAGAHQQPPC